MATAVTTTATDCPTTAAPSAPAASVARAAPEVRGRWMPGAPACRARLPTLRTAVVRRREDRAVRPAAAIPGSSAPTSPPSTERAPRPSARGAAAPPTTARPEPRSAGRLPSEVGSAGGRRTSGVPRRVPRLSVHRVPARRIAAPRCATGTVAWTLAAGTTTAVRRRRTVGCAPSAPARRRSCVAKLRASSCTGRRAGRTRSAAAGCASGLSSSARVRRRAAATTTAEPSPCSAISGVTTFPSGAETSCEPAPRVARGRAWPVIPVAAATIAAVGAASMADAPMRVAAMRRAVDRTSAAVPSRARRHSSCGAHRCRS